MVNSKSHTKALTLIRQMVPDLVFENIVMNRAPIDTATSDGVPLWELQYGHVAAKEIKAVIHGTHRKSERAMNTSTTNMPFSPRSISELASIASRTRQSLNASVDDLVSEAQECARASPACKSWVRR